MVLQNLLFLSFWLLQMCFAFCFLKVEKQLHRCTSKLFSRLLDHRSYWPVPCSCQSVPYWFHIFSSEIPLFFLGMFGMLIILYNKMIFLIPRTSPKNWNKHDLSNRYLFTFWSVLVFYFSDLHKSDMQWYGLYKIPLLSVFFLIIFPYHEDIMNTRLHMRLVALYPESK